MLLDRTASPPRYYEAVTATEHALAFLMTAIYEPDRPDHGEGSLRAATWFVIPHGAPADVEPALLTFERALGSRPFEVSATGECCIQLGDGMNAAVGA
jgi:hypothetical protein